MSSLWAAPFLLTSEGTLIKARVRALNNIGWSDYSAANTVGATVQTVPGPMTAPTRGPASTTTVINIQWTVVADNGGPSIDSYNLQWDSGSNGVFWLDLQGNDGSFSTALSFLSSPSSLVVTGGITYGFRVRAHNALGWSPSFSPVLYMIASDVPSQPSPVTTQVNNHFVRVSWSAVINNNFQAIDIYQVVFLDSLNVPQTIPAYCDASLAVIATQRYCDVPMTVFTSSPFNLVPGTLIKAMVKAHNVLGWSAYSSVNTVGVIAQTSPS